MKPFALSMVLVGSLALAVSSAACGSGSEQSQFAEADAGGDASTPVSRTLRLEPSTLTAEVTLGGAKKTLSVRAFGKIDGGPEREVTSEIALSVASTAIASPAGAGALTLQGAGGKTNVQARWGDATADAPLVVKLVGDAFGAGTDASTKTAFTSAADDPDATHKPALEYPEDGAVLPANLPPIQPQWSQTADSDTYRIRVTAPDVLDVTIYTKSREPTLDAPTWKAITASTPDVETTIAVEAMGPSKLLRKSAARRLTVTADTIDDSAVYVWRPNTGSFRVLDIVRGTDVDLPNDSPALAKGQTCSGCHRISRDGKRFSYSFGGAAFQIGTLAFDAASSTFKAKIAPAATKRGTYATFNPNEAATRPAMILTVPDSVQPNTAGTVRLELVDPDTGATIPSNVSSLAKALEQEIGTQAGTLMPDWSPSGDFVVFVSHDTSKNFVRLLGDDVVLGSIVEVPVTYDANAKSFTFGAPKVRVKANGGANPDTGENNVLPTVSPDGATVAFTRAAGWWSIKTQQSLLNLSGQIMLLRRSDGAVIELARGSNGGGTTRSSTWPQWAPTFGQRYAWLAYASERPYGHVLTSATPQNAKCSLVQGQKQCKQLWITALDRKKLAAGSDDPSAAPFWVPGQDTESQYVSPQWTKAVLPPPR